MRILAIDTSCDDTSIAVAERQNKKIAVLSNIVSSQVKLHSRYGGVFPSLAKREHQKNLAPVLKQSLQKAKLLKKILKKNGSNHNDRYGLNQGEKIKTLRKILQRDGPLLEKTRDFLSKYQKPKIDAIAVTAGPGLEPCLWQGVNFAKALAFWWDLALIPINHIKAHLAANFISGSPTTANFPAIGLVASGGHTELALMGKPNKYKLIGATRDDAAGECFDKTARILGLPYPGGPAIAAEAAKKLSVINNQLLIKLPRPMINSNDFDFSFSGLKTAVLYDWKKRKKAVRESQEYKSAMAKEIQQTIIDVLITKAISATKKYKARSIITGGGVMSNKELRKQFRNKIKSEKLHFMFYVPSYRLCLDNAAMVAMEALIAKPKTQSWRKIKANANLNI